METAMRSICLSLVLAMLSMACSAEEDTAALREQLAAARKEIAKLKAEQNTNLPQGASLLQQVVFADLDIVLPEKHRVSALYAKALAAMQKQFPATPEQKNVELLQAGQRELLKVGVDLSLLEMMQEFSASARGHTDDNDLSSYLRLWLARKRQEKK
jgi:hypothetical protein